MLRGIGELMIMPPTDMMNSTWNIALQFGAVGIFALVFGYVNYRLVRKIIDNADSDKKLLLETLTNTISENTSAMNNVANAIREMGHELPNIRKSGANRAA